MTQEQDKNREICTFLATGLIQQCADIYRGQPSVVTNLNSALRFGWEKLSFQCYTHGITPPQTLEDLVTWLHLPFSEWGITLPADWSDKTLLSNDVPTEFCDELGAELAKVGDLRLEMQDSVFRELHEECRKFNDATLYTAMREFLILHPILDDVLPHIQQNRVWPPEVREKLRRCYESIPAKCIIKHEGTEWIACCPHCGWALAWTGEKAICHKNGVCAEAYGDLSEDVQWLQYDPAMCRTTEGIQRYVVAPEVVLLILRNNLQKIPQVTCTLFPHFDAYDMLIALPNGKKWAIDLKDHRDPARLGGSLKPFAGFPAWDKAFIVFPNHRKSSDYLNRFRNLWTKRGKNESVLFADELLRDVKKAAR